MKLELLVLLLKLQTELWTISFTAHALWNLPPVLTSFQMLGNPPLEVMSCKCCVQMGVYMYMYVYHVHSFQKDSPTMCVAFLTMPQLMSEGGLIGGEICIPLDGMKVWGGQLQCV